MSFCLYTKYPCEEDYLPDNLCNNFVHLLENYLMILDELFQNPQDKDETHDTDHQTENI